MGKSQSAENVNLSDPAEWLDRHGDVLYRYAVTRVRRGDVAEDLVQETFLAALRSRGQFEGRSTERTWLVSILRRKIADLARSGGRAGPAAQADVERIAASEFFDRRGVWSTSIARWPTDPARSVENEEFWQALDECLRKLPPAVAETFSLRELDGFAAEEICKILEITPSNLSVRMHRARLALRRCLEAGWFAQG